MVSALTFTVADGVTFWDPPVDFGSSATSFGVSASVSFDVCAPPVLTVTPGGAAEVVPTVDVGAVVAGLAGVVTGSVAGAGSLVVTVDVVTVDVVAVDVVAVDVVAVEVVAVEAVSCDGLSCDGVPDAGVSAHAVPPPLATAIPTPSAIARVPTRPTYSAAFMATFFTPGSQRL